MININFLAFAINKKKGPDYEEFLIPFTFFALMHNKKSHVEIIVVNPEEFIKKYCKEILELKKINKNFLIRKPQHKLNKHLPNTYRFFEVPTVKSKYTYISDIDIMYLENIVPKYLADWPSKIPYHNILRSKKSVRLTGVMMVKTKKFYTNAFKKCQNKYYKKNCRKNDEVILGEMCQKIHGLPDNNFRYRPIFGIHFSPNRGPNKRMQLATTNVYNDKFINIADKYDDLFNYPCFQMLMKNLNSQFIFSKYQENIS